MHGAHRLALAACTALALALVLAPAASAKVWFADMGGRMVGPPQRVTTQILGCSGNPACSATVRGDRVLLRRVGSRRVRALARIDAEGRLRFRVPYVRAGRYLLVVRLRLNSSRRLLPISDVFRILRKRPSRRD